MNKTNSLLSKIFIVLLILPTISCKKKIIEKEVVVEKSTILAQKYLQDSKYELYNGLHLKKFISEVKDSIIIDSCDLNFDGLYDIYFGYQIKNENKQDSLILESYIEKINTDFEFLYENINYVPYLNPYYDTNNYISPSSTQWQYQSQIKKYILCRHLLEECIVDNVPQLCIKSQTGFYTPFNQSFNDYYYQGFRFKNKINKFSWNYGYFIIDYTALAIGIKMISFDEQQDVPIGIRKFF